MFFDFNINWIFALVVALLIFHIVLWLVNRFAKKEVPELTDDEQARKLSMFLVDKLRSWGTVLIIAGFLIAFLLTGLRFAGKQEKYQELPARQFKSLEYKAPNIKRELLNKGDALQDEGDKSLQDFRKKKGLTK